MISDNPYSPPNAALSTPGATDETYQPEVFAMQGRIGRLRYIAYSFGALLIIESISTIIFGLVAARLLENMKLLMLIRPLFLIPSIAVAMILAKRRLHDINRSGWLSLIMIVPVLSFLFSIYLMLFPGSSTANAYGPRPERNSLMVTIIAIAGFPLICAFRIFIIKNYFSAFNF